MQQQVPGPEQAPRAQARPPHGGTAQPGAGEVLYEGIRKHSASFGAYLKWLLVSAIGGLAAWGLYQVEGLGAYPLWLLSLIGLPGLFAVFLEHATTRYKITRRRVEFEHGVLSKQVDSLELWRVLDVRYRQTFLDRILGNGRITLVGTDRTDPELELYGLPNHRKLFEDLREAVQMARHSNRPMEFVGHENGESFEPLQ